MSARGAARALAALGALCPLAAAAQAVVNPATQTEGPAVEVIATTPIPGLGTQLHEVPATVHSVNAKELRRQGARDLPEHLERNVPGVNLNSAQGNPHQQDLQYRGFSASPLLGTPQGISVFVDGVRVNEAFGDMVNWDLIPRNAIATAHLLSGSNPIFGLNTLGGVLSIHTKSGFAFPGTSAQVAAGSFGLRAVEFEHGGHGERGDRFIAASALDETGWREHSSTRLRTAFVKGGWQDSRSDIDVSLAVADNALEGTQALPAGMLAANPRQAYTWPDRTENTLAFLTVRASRYVQNDILVAGSAYVRGLRQVNVSSNVNDDFDPGLALAPGNAQAFNDRGTLDQTMSGAAVQVTAEKELGEAFNLLTLGAAVDRASTDYAQDRQEASFTADRDTAALGAYAPRVRVAGETTYLGLYVSDQLALTPAWLLTFAGRYTVARVSLRDQSGMQPALDGDHEFRRFNPALGVNWNPTSRQTFFAAYGESMRVPTPVELTCADPAAPCSLPNQFLADPPLKPVVARTLELGTRLRPTEQARFSASVYRTTLTDDILFVSSSSAVNAGFFQNAGKTLRQGVDLGAQFGKGAFTLSAGYSYVHAVYLTPFTMLSPNNSSRDAFDQITVENGNRLPGIPQDSVKLLLDWTPNPRSSAGFGWTWFGRQYARGDENNRDANGALPAYGIARFFARHELQRGWEIALKVDNLFDQRYENLAVLGRNFFTGPGNSFDAAAATPEQFRAPGAPRSIWASLRYDFDRKPSR